jgi:hypothetical protein
VERPRIVILTALRMEANAIARHFGARGPRGSDPVELPQPLLAGPLAGRVQGPFSIPAIHLYVIGVGAVRVPPLDGRALSGIIMAGLAGALDPALSVGDVLIDQESNWKLDNLPYPLGRFETATEVVGSVAAKADLFQRTGAAAVEMENDTIRKLAADMGIPFLGIRAISDSATQAVDPAILRFVDPFGSVRLGALVGGVVRRPSVVAELRRLSRSSAVALAALGDAAMRVIIDTVRR